jgi:hypothetical protein
VCEREERDRRQIDPYHLIYQVTNVGETRVTIVMVFGGGGGGRLFIFIVIRSLSSLQHLSL